MFIVFYYEVMIMNEKIGRDEYEVFIQYLDVFCQKLQIGMTCDKTYREIFVLSSVIEEFFSNEIKHYSSHRSSSELNKYSDRLNELYTVMNNWYFLCNGDIQDENIHKDNALCYKNMVVNNSNTSRATTFLSPLIKKELALQGRALLRASLQNKCYI